MPTQTTTAPTPLQPSTLDADLGQRLLEAIWEAVSCGAGIVDDLSGEPIRGLGHYADLLDLDHPRALSDVEGEVLAGATAAPGSRGRSRGATRRTPGFADARGIDFEAETRALVARRPEARERDRDADLADRFEPAWDRADARRAAARTHERLIKATALIAQHVANVHGRFPATRPATSPRATNARRTRRVVAG